MRRETRGPMTAAELARVHMIMPGEHFVSPAPAVLGTLLGSCVSACMWDPVLGVGGMNHFMLPDAPDHGAPSGAPARYGLYAMEVLINDLLRRGAQRERIRTKVFGGANMTGSDAREHIGSRNARFVLSFLAEDGFIPEVAELGGDNCRRIYFETATGVVRMNRVKKREGVQVLDAEARYGQSLSAAPVEGELTFF